MTITGRFYTKPYNVRELKFSDFFDLDQLSKVLISNKSKKYDWRGSPSSGEEFQVY